MMAETALINLAHSNSNNNNNSSMNPTTSNNNDLTQTMVKLLSHWQDFQSRARLGGQQQSLPAMTAATKTTTTGMMMTSTRSEKDSASQASETDRPASGKGLPPTLKNLLNNSNDTPFELHHLLPATTTTTTTSTNNDNKPTAVAEKKKRSSRRRSRATPQPTDSNTSNWSTTVSASPSYPGAYLQESRQLRRPVAVRPGSSQAFASLALAASSCPSSPTSSSMRGFSSPVASPPNPSTPEFAPVNPFGQKQVHWDESETRSRSSSIDCSPPQSHSPSPSPPAGSKKRELIFCTIFSESDLNGDKPKQKRRRKELTQLEILEEIFKKDPLPSRKTKERLALEVGLPHRAVQVWFQNRRAKERRSLRDQGVGESPAMPNPWAKAE